MMVKYLKTVKYDENGYQIIAQATSYYLAKTKEGEVLKIYKNIPKRKSNVNPKSIENLTKTDEGRKKGSFENFPENTLTGNAGGKISKQRKQDLDTGTDWHHSQRACLKKMLQMPASTIYAYMVLWKQMSVDQVLTSYGYNIVDADLRKLEQGTPTMVQLLCISMVLRAQADGKFALSILEMVEGRAVNWLQQSEKEKDAEKSKEVVSQSRPEIDETLDQLKNLVFASERAEEGKELKPRVEVVTPAPVEEPEEAFVYVETVVPSTAEVQKEEERDLSLLTGAELLSALNSLEEGRE